MLEAERVGVRRGAALLLDAVSVAVRPGEILALAGANGAGKSTLLRVLAGLEAPATGRTVLDGEPLATLRRQTRARRIAYLPQERHLEWALTVREVVALAGLVRGAPIDAAVETAMEATGIAHLARRSAATLSGGETARTLFARALAVGADYLLADEPGMALDPEHQLMLMQALGRVRAQGAGVVVVLHDLTHIVRYADRVALLVGGKLVGYGPPATMLTGERIAQVYGVESISGRHEGESYIVPWRNLRQPVRIDIAGSGTTSPQP